MCLAAPVPPVSRTDGMSNTAKRKHKTLTIVSQNVRGLKSDERVEEICSSMNQRRIFATCVQETWRSDKEALQHGNCCILATGLKRENNSRRGSQGVGIILSAAATDAWKAAGSEIHNTYGARVMAVRLLVRDNQGRDVHLFLVSGYAPVGAADNSIWEEYFQNLDECISRKKSDDILIIGCDTNSSMGSANDNSSIGSFGLSHMNESGRRFASHLTINNLVAATTCFRKRNYGTWIHPRSKSIHQIDHFITEKQTICRLTDAGVTGQLVDSDHLAIQCKLRIMLRLKKVTPIRQKLALVDYNVLADPLMKETFCKSVLDKIRKSSDDTSMYTRLSGAVQQTASQLPKKTTPQPGWFQQAEHELLPLIEKRNSAMKQFHERRSRSNATSLRLCRKAIKSAVLIAKNRWIKSKHNDLNSRSAITGTKGCWDALKQLRNGLSKTRPSSEKTMKKEDGTLCETAEENAEVFRSHFEKLYGQPPVYDRSVIDLIPQRPVVSGLDHPPDDEELITSISLLKDNAPGDSGIPAKVWKTLSEYEETFDVLKFIILDFWETELTPSEWETGLLTILAKKGDLSLPGNYRGIMLLETAYKIVAVILNKRLQIIEEGLAELHENQCGFRTERGCTDANFIVKMAMKKRREHGLESWILFLDLVKAFDRVPRELLWSILEKVGVPPKLVRLLQSLHQRFFVKFAVNDIIHQIHNIIGVKQGDILGPRLFNLFMFAVMQTWHATDTRQLCMFYSKPDFTLTGRSYRARGGEEFSLPDSQYADDTAVLFTSRESLENTMRALLAHFARFGLEIHVGKPEKLSKTEILFVPAPANCYKDPKTYDNADLSNVELGNDEFFPIVDVFCYLGSMLSSDCSDTEDVRRRIAKASSAFGAVRAEIFANRNVFFEAKKLIYEGLILPILLYGSETWCLTEDLFNRLRTFHARCIRAMCRVNRHHTWKHRISSAELRNRTGLKTIDSYITQRQLRWAGHVARMDFGRLPRKMMTSWVRHPRPRGCPRFTYGRGLNKALKKADVDNSSWFEMASDRLQWGTLLKSL